MSLKVVLIADDNPITVKILSRKLAKLAIDHVVAMCGHEALSFLTESLRTDNRIIVAILDEDMKGGPDCIKGTEVVRRCNEEFPENEISFISFSANKLESSTGFVGVFNKEEHEPLITEINKLYFKK